MSRRVLRWRRSSRSPHYRFRPRESNVSRLSTPIRLRWCPSRSAPARSDATQSRDPQATSHTLVANVGPGSAAHYFASLILRRARDTQSSNLLIIFADLGMGAQHHIHRFEQVVHALLGHWALDHDNQFRLVG